MSKSSHFWQIVRVCQEFQKYTGNEEPIVCNVNSKHTGNFHIHPQLLATNFFERRIKFYNELKKIVLEIPTKNELINYLHDDQVSFMLHHFGIQTVLEKLKKYEEKERITKLIKTTKNIDNDSDIDDEMVEKCRRESKELSPISETFLILTILHNKKKLKQFDPIYYTQHILFGHLILANLEKLYKILSHHNTLGKLKKILNVHVKAINLSSDFQHKKRAKINRNDVISICKLLKSWTKNGINGLNETANNYKLNGIELLRKNYFCYNECNVCHHKKNTNHSIHFGAETFSEYWISSRNISDKHHYSKTIGVIKICIGNDLVSRVKELFYLSIACAISKEHFIAVKMLKISLKLSDGFIETDELKDADKCLDEMNDACWTTKCKHCKAKATLSKHQACTGCMLVAYCSKKCQKIHWNTKHRNICNGSWKSIYKALKMTIFDRVKQ